jgi:hypothetical protein
MNPKEIKLHYDALTKELNESMLRYRANRKFRAYFWKHIELPETELRTALLSIMADNTEERKLEAFQQLLTSDYASAQGVAFDQFAYAEVQVNRGAENLFRECSEQVLSKARAQLISEPVTAVNEDKKIIVGANHASALAVLQFIGQEEDIPSIEQILRTSKDANVLYGACDALEHCLRQSDDTHREIVEILRPIIFDENANPSVREQAILVFLEYYFPEAEPMLVQAAQQCTLIIAAQAAWVLGIWNFEKYRSLLAEISLHWSEEEVPYYIRRVRELLNEHTQDTTTDDSVEKSPTITEEQPNSNTSSTQKENEPLTAHSLQERFEASLPQLQKTVWCEQINSQYGHFREGTNTGFAISGRKEAIEDIYDHFFPNAVIGFEPEELQQWLSSGYQSHPNYGIEALQPKTISNLRKPDVQDTDEIIALATQDATRVEQFFCELLGIKRAIF